VVSYAVSQNPNIFTRRSFVMQPSKGIPRMPNRGFQLKHVLRPLSLKSLDAKFFTKVLTTRKALGTQKVGGNLDGIGLITHLHPWVISAPTS
jgi:hypothetical protein